MVYADIQVSGEAYGILWTPEKLQSLLIQIWIYKTFWNLSGVEEEPEETVSCVW
jgi:hypothetical protein